MFPNALRAFILNAVNNNTELKLHIDSWGEVKNIYGGSNRLNTTIYEKAKILLRRLQNSSKKYHIFVFFITIKIF